MALNLTPKQLTILNRIRESRLTRGYSPTMQELADELNVSKVTVFEHVEALIRKGALLRQKNKARSLEVAPDLPHVVGDRDELTQVVENLVENALRYGASGERIEVAVAPVPGGVELAVRDHGEGIAPEHQPRLTERFYRVNAARSRSRMGTGLGLAIVKHILARHGARVVLRSRVGEGARFSFALPIHRGPTDDQ